MFLYLIRMCISTQVVILKCKQFSGWLRQNVSISGMGYLLSKWCVYEIGMRIPFSNGTDLWQIICICMLLMTSFLTAYCVPSYSCQCQYLLKCNILKYCNIWSNQRMSHGAIFTFQNRMKIEESYVYIHKYIYFYKYVYSVCTCLVHTFHIHTFMHMYVFIYI